MKIFILAVLMSSGLLASAPANAGTGCHPILANWVNAATMNCPYESPGASNGGGPEVTSAPPRECECPRECDYKDK
jgi:hypothetical protein